MLEHWVKHFREEDRELLGWIEATGDKFQVYNLLGRQVGLTSDWLEAEAILNRLGISYLASPYRLRLSDDLVKDVLLVDVSSSGILVKVNKHNDIRAQEEFFTLPFPAPPNLEEAADR